MLLSITGPSAFLLLWSFGVLLSWIGWGRLAARWAVGRRRIDTGLCAAWGMAILVAIGGVLNATRLCSRSVVIGLTTVGIVLAVPSTWRVLRRTPRYAAVILRRVGPMGLALIGSVFMLLVSIGMSEGGGNLIDDPPFYMTLPLRMLESGAADDPLNGRRLTTFGGYAFLQAQVMASGHHFAAGVVDLGLSQIVVALLLVGLVRRGPGRWIVLGVVALAWLYSWPRLNTAAGTAITMAVLAMWRTVRLADTATPSRRTRLLALAAVLATAAATFRANLQVLPAVFFALYFVVRVSRSPAVWRRAVGEAVVVLAVGLLALLPWSVSLYRSSGSLLYPLMHGNHRDARYSYSTAGITVSERLAVAGKTLASPAFVLVTLPLLVLVWRRQWTGVYLYAATLIMVGSTAYAFPSAGAPWLERFCIPALLAPAIVGLDAVLRLKPVLAIRTTLGLGVAAILLWPGRPVWQMAVAYVELAKVGLHHRNLPPAPPTVVEAYADLQRAVPSGATIATAVSHPVLFDFGRNPIYCLDSPGFATKQGLWPFHQGPEAVRQFLIDQGVDYLAFNDFDNQAGLYERQYWTAASSFEPIAFFYLNMMDDFETLWRQSPHVYEGQGLRLLRLR